MSLIIALMQRYRLHGHSCCAPPRAHVFTDRHLPESLAVSATQPLLCGNVVMSSSALQMKDMRKGSMMKPLSQCAVVEASVKVAEDTDVEAAERAVLGLSQQLDPVVKMASAH